MPGIKAIRLLAPVGLALLVLSPAWAEADPLLLTVSPRDDVLRTIDAATGATIDDSVVMSLDGSTINGATGLARHPMTDELYVLLRLQGRTFPDLVTVDELTGVATLVGHASDKFAGLTFAPGGTLYAVSGDGGVVPERLFTLSTVNGSSTLVTSLGAGSDGETIAFNSDDGLIYHASGIGMQNNNAVGEIFETIDPISLTITNVPLSGFDYQELTGLAYSGGSFVAGDLGSQTTDMPRLFRITTAGVVTYVADLDHVAKGFAPVLPLEPPDAIPTVSPPGLALLALLLVAGGCWTLGTGSPARKPLT